MIEAKYLWSQKNLYFLGLYKSLRVVSKFMDLEWCRREKNQNQNKRSLKGLCDKSLKQKMHPFLSNNCFGINELANHLGWFPGFSKYSFSNKIENQAGGSLESLCDKNLKTKNVIRPNYMFVQANRGGIWFDSQIFCFDHLQ